MHLVNRQSMGSNGIIRGVVCQFLTARLVSRLHQVGQRLATPVDGPRPHSIGTIADAVPGQVCEIGRDEEDDLCFVKYERANPTRRDLLECRRETETCYSTLCSARSWAIMTRISRIAGSKTTRKRTSAWFHENPTQSLRAGLLAKGA
jgi:hypothetical protein